MKNLFPLTALCLALLPAVRAEPRSLFNGQDLSGWKVAVGDQGLVDRQDIFTVHDGLIHVYPTQEHGSKQPYAGIVTEQEFSHYRLSLEYKWGDDKFHPRFDMVRDAGIMFHVHGPVTMWPNSVECQIQEGDTGDLWIVGSQASSPVQDVIRNYSPRGNLETRGSLQPRFARFHRAYSWETPGWNTVVVEVRGDQARFFVNGQLVNEARDMKRWDEAQKRWVALDRGPILLQAEGAELFYRNVRIEELKP